jgi:SNF2 family DNA or RNA helicase
VNFNIRNNLKALYIPTNTNTFIVKEIDSDFVEILLDGEYKVVPADEVRELDDEAKIISFDEFNQNLLASLIVKPSSDLLYSSSTNRLTPEPHQYKPLIKFLNSQNNRLLIADEVGLGKTIEAGMIFKEIDKRDDLAISLIVVPSSLTLKWRSEMLMRFDEDFEILKTSDFKNFLKEYEIYGDSKAYSKKMIISYHALRDDNVIELLKDSSLTIDCLIMDEAHTFRNENTSTFTAAFSITNISDYVLFLTATPVQNSYNDLFNILTLLDNETFLDFDYFMDLIKPNSIIHKVVAQLKNGTDLVNIQDYVSSQDFDYLQLTFPQKGIFKDFMSKNSLTREERVDFISDFTESDNLSYIISRTKKKDAGKFIPREAISTSIEITEHEQDYYNAVVEFVKYLFLLKNPKIPTGFITVMPERMASSCMLASIESFKHMRSSKKFYVSQIDDHDTEVTDFELDKEILSRLDLLISKGSMIGETDSKYDAFVEFLDDLKKQKIQKAIVFSFFKKTLSYLEKKLIDRGFKIGKIDGDIDPEERYEIINQFRENEFDILLSSEVGSEGLDMQFCNVIFNYDLPWNPMRIEQRIGRIDRIGQPADKLFIFNMIVKGTIEDRIYSRLYDRLGIFESSIGELEPILGDIQNEFQVQDIIEMSEEELKQKLEIQEQSLIRRAKEIEEHGSKLDGMLNDDYNRDEKKLDNDSRKSFIRDNCQRLFVSYLKTNNINYREQEGVYTLKKDDSKKLYDLLTPFKYKGNNATTRAQQKKALKGLLRPSYSVTFESTPSMKSSVNMLAISNPLLKMIASQSLSDFSEVSVVSSNLDGSYAVVYKSEFKSFKERVKHRVLVLDSNLKSINDIDYFDFYGASASNGLAFDTTMLNKAKNSAQKIISEEFNRSLEHEKLVAGETLNKKRDALHLHYKKKRDMAEKASLKAFQEDIIRMRQSQIDNINGLEKERITQLENKMKVNGSFQILSILKLAD